MTTLPLEHALLRRSFDDGWLDILVGTGLIAIGTAWLLDAVIAGAAIPAILVPVWLAGRKSIVEPRLAQPRFRDTQLQAKRRDLTGWFILGAAVLLAEIAVVFSAHKAGAADFALLSEFAVGIPAALVAVGLLAGLVASARRFILYSLAAFGIAASGALLQSEAPGLLIALCGVLPLVSGGVLMLRFLSRHPLTERAGDE